MKGFIVFSILILFLPLLLRESYHVSIASYTGIYTIVTVGLALLMGYAGQISLGQAAFFGIGAYSSAVLTTQYSLNPWVALLVSILLPAVVAFIMGQTLSRLNGYYLAIATLALGIIVHTVFVELKGVTKGSSGLYGIPKLEIFNFTISAGVSYYYLIWLFALAVIFLSLNIINSRVGRALRSIHGSEVASRSLGVNTGSFKMQVLIISAMFAGLAGFLYTHMHYSINPSSFGIDTSILFVTMVVLGGVKSIWGAILGTSLVFLIKLSINTLGTKYSFITSEFEHVIFGAILMAVIIFMPEGLFPTIIKLFKKKSSKLKSINVIQKEEVEAKES